MSLILKKKTDLDIKVMQKIRQRRLQMLVHSCIYYRMNTNIVCDDDFDRWNKELRELHEKYPKESQKVRYAEHFKDWVGRVSGGSHLPITDPYIVDKAIRLINYHERLKNGEV